MFSYQSKYCLAAAMAAMAALTGHVEARDIDLKSIGYFQFSPLPPSLVSQTDTLLLSDSPEYVGPVGGTLSAGTINGNGRIYFYHVNEMSQPHKMAIVLENQTPYASTVHVMRQLKSVASKDYFAAGRDLSRQDLEHPLDESPTAKPLYSLSIPPKGRQLIFSDLENTPIPQDALFTGLVDVKTDAPVYARVMMLPMDLNSVEASHWVNNLPIDEIQLRGTYTGAKRNMEVTTPYDTALGGAYVEIGNDREDVFINGVDEMQNKAFVRDRGNYGVSYTLKIPTKGEEPFRLYFNPLGGPYSGSFTVKALHQQGARRGETDTRTYHIGGADGVSALGDGTILDSRLMGNYNAGDELTLSFMPAGASNLPIRFLFIPESLANPQQQQTIAVEVSKEAKDSLGHPTEGLKNIPVGTSKGAEKGRIDTTKPGATDKVKSAESIAHEETKKLSDKAAAEAKREEKLKQAKKLEEVFARKKAEEARVAADKAAEERKAAEAKQAEIERKMAEEARQAAEAERIEAERKAEIAKIEALKQAEEAKRAEEARKAEAARKAEEAKQAEEARKAEAARIEEEAKSAENANKEAVARIEAARKAEADRQAAERKRAENERKAEQARQAAEAKRIAAAHKEAVARIEAARKAEEARRIKEAKQAEEARKAEAARVEAARKAEEIRKAAEVKRIEEERKAEEARIVAEAKRAEEARKAEEDRKAAEAKRAEDQRRAEAARIESERQAELARQAEAARQAEQERLAAERAEAERQAAEAKRIAEERYQEHLMAERKAEEARQQALAQAESERKAKERAEAIQRLQERQAYERRKAEMARQQLEAERQAAERARRGRSFEELDDTSNSAPKVYIPDAISIEELTKPRPTASQNTRPREQREQEQQEQQTQQQEPQNQQQEQQNQEQNNEQQNQQNGAQNG